MKVIMLQDVKKVGKKGEVKEVSVGFANNFLFPKKLAVAYTQGSINVLAQQKEEERLKDVENTKNAQEIAAKLKDITLIFEVTTGVEGKLFGSVSLKQVEEELRSKYGIDIDKRKFITKENINSLGYTRLDINLYKDVVGTVDRKSTRLNSSHQIIS